MINMQCYAPWYGSVPGLKVVAPYSSEDARGLLKAAIRDPDPVVFLENEYGESFPVSEEVLDPSFTLPIGKAKIEKEGRGGERDVTITAFSRMVAYALKAADTLAKEDIDDETDLTSMLLRKTNSAVLVEEGFPQQDVGAEICASVVEEIFEYLDAPVERITGADVPMPYAAILERMALPQLISPIIVRYTTTFFILSLPPSPFASIGANFSSPLMNFRQFQQFAGMTGDEGLVPSPEEELERRNAIDKLKQVRLWSVKKEVA
ncbi:hypothetical protein RND71_003446 [Anisodus tanguticus]|uniref:Pyruvate dehydrogenase E1 component subunit beta n=1 Tax=Anisodus tanguticus TaxID=243964 RepID=A0AAE1SWN6_9SOLA|nr:hypothetical protein RND71_003446 [Anisodus tanguticus]